ncbi:MAG: hypothetical protein FD180_1638 [Planctomycetota bacterium]|nr:MAG: hypothetical protein FD180_1638 [Planctomycetota bacterium]
MGDSSVPAPGDRLTDLVHAAVTASLARRTANLRPREVQELTAEARAQLDEMVRQRDSDSQRLALLERAREKLGEELGSLQAELSASELNLEEVRKAVLRGEKRGLEHEKATDGIRLELNRKGVELEDVEGRLRSATAESERERGAAMSFPEGVGRSEAMDGVAHLTAQAALLAEARDVLRRESAALGEALREREKERDADRAALREAREKADALQQEGARLAEAVGQKRGIEVKVGEEWERARSDAGNLSERVAALEKSEGLGPVIAELRREAERARVEGRDDRLAVAQLSAQVRDLAESSARSNAALAHFRETLSAVEADRDRLDDVVRRERRIAAERQRAMARRAEEAEDRPPAGSDPAAWDRLRAQFETRLKDYASRISDLEREKDAMRQELDNARSLLARATVERQQLRVRVESMELASVSAAAGGQLDALKNDLRRLEMERDEARREIAALRSRLESLDMTKRGLEQDRERMAGELKERTGGGFLKKLGRAFGGD